MRIIILGAGNAGRQLAKRLCDEKHNVILIDPNPQALALAETTLDVMTLCGSGANPELLEEAQIHKANLLLAVTDNDQTNLLACLLAHQAGVPEKIARVTSPYYTQTTAHYDPRAMGINLLINQKEECAREVFNILQMPAAVEAFELFSGKILVAGFPINAGSPLRDRTPAECDRLDLIQSIRVLAIRRNNELVIPHGDTLFQKDDIVYLVGKRKDISAFTEWIRPDVRPLEKVIIAGGGDIGLMLAKLVEKEMNCVLLEQDEDRARFCSAHLDRTLVLRADSLTESALEESGLHNRTAFVALTGDDEGNIMNCLMAQKKGASYTATQINRTDFIPVVEQLYLVNRVISPYQSTTNAILHYLRSQKVQAASLLHNLPGELLDLLVTPETVLHNRAIRELKIPRKALIAAVLREGEVLTATGDLTLQENDRILIFCHPDAIKKIQSAFLS